MCQQVTVPLVSAGGSVAEVKAEGFLQKALINWFDFISFSPHLKMNKKIIQRHKMKQHLRIVRYWFEATGPADSRASVCVGDCLLGQMIRPSIRIQRNAERKLADINICNTSASSNHMWSDTCNFNMICSITKKRCLKKRKGTWATVRRTSESACKIQST